jgi:GDPmannose 4,6-dehydratase
VEVTPRYLRPAEVDHLLGDAAKARAQLGWKPKVNFQELVRMMVEHDKQLAIQERVLLETGGPHAQRGVSAS